MNRRDGLAQPQIPAWESLKNALLQAWPIQNFSAVTVLIGVSGGADSVCLLRLLHELSPPPTTATKTSHPSRKTTSKMVVGHFNHKLRGRESDADAAFVQQLAATLQLECRVAEAESPSSVSDASEESLRNQRYEFFLQTASQLGARYVALAHTANDCLETVLHHLFRGSGPAGLGGIPPFRDLGSDLVIARPLLHVTREQIQAGLEEIGQPHRHDQSNDADDWNRNWLRNVLLPLVRQRYPRADESILRASSLIAAQHRDLQELADRYFDEAFQVDEHKLRIHPQTMHSPLWPSGTSPRVPQSLFVAAAVRAWDQLAWPRGDMSHRHLRDLWHLVVARTPSSLNLPGNIRATRKADGSVVVERSSCD